MIVAPNSRALLIGIISLGLGDPAFGQAPAKTGEGSRGAAAQKTPAGKSKKTEKELAAEKAAAAKKPPVAAVKPVVVTAKKPVVVTKKAAPAEKPASAKKAATTTKKAATPAEKEQAAVPPPKAAAPAPTPETAKTDPAVPAAKTAPKFKPAELEPVDAKPKSAETKPPGTAIEPPPLPEKTPGRVEVPPGLPGSTLVPGANLPPTEPLPEVLPEVELLPRLEMPTPFGDVVVPRVAYTPKPVKERIYSVGKFVITYAKPEVVKKNKKIPPPEKLGELPVLLAQEGGVYYHIPMVGHRNPEKAAEDPALKARLAGGKKPVEKKPTPPPPAPKPKKDSKNEKAGVGKPPEAAPFPPGIEVVPFVPAAGLTARRVSARALVDIYDSIVKQLNDQGLIGVYFESDLDPREGDVAWVAGSDVHVIVYVSEVAKIRTIFRKIPFRLSEGSMINDPDALDGQTEKDPKHLWIKKESMIPQDAIMERKLLSEYLSRLNRFPGRRVDAAMNAEGKPGKIILDYLIKEQKPFSLYLQSSNTGTETTGEWRHRIGGEYKQLLNLDDTLRMEIATSEPDKFLSLFGSYEFALKKPDFVKARVYGTYGKYAAQDIGLSLQSFEGENLTLGGSVTYTPMYWRGFPLDLTIGAELLHVTVNNFDFGEGEGSFVLPFFGIGTERRTDEFTLALNLEVQASVGGPSQEDLDALGRLDTSAEFFLGKWEFGASAYLDPLFYGKKWRDYGLREKMTETDRQEFVKMGGKSVLGVDEAAYFTVRQKAEQKWRRGARVHELALATRGQYVLDGKRLSPQLEFVAGGFNTVRGYPESFSAGDNAIIGSLEYRLHIARLFTPYEVLDARNDLQTLRSRKSMPPPPVAVVKGKGKKSPAPAPVPSPVMASLTDRARPFNFRAPQVGGDPDWDLIFRVFADGGKTYNNDLQIATEVDRTLLSVGAGLELQIYKPLYMSFRLDYGMALSEESELLLEPVKAGDTRIHVSGTIAW